MTWQLVEAYGEAGTGRLTGFAQVLERIEASLASMDAALYCMREPGVVSLRKRVNRIRRLLIRINSAQQARSRFGIEAPAGGSKGSLAAKLDALLHGTLLAQAGQSNGTLLSDARLARFRQWCWAEVQRSGAKLGRRELWRRIRRLTRLIEIDGPGLPISERCRLERRVRLMTRLLQLKEVRAVARRAAAGRGKMRLIEGCLRDVTMMIEHDSHR